jgi:hypothetical protein
MTRQLLRFDRRWSEREIQLNIAARLDGYRQAMAAQMASQIYQN